MIICRLLTDLSIIGMLTTCGHQVGCTECRHTSKLGQFHPVLVQRSIINDLGTRIIKITYR